MGIRVMGNIVNTVVDKTVINVVVVVRLVHYSGRRPGRNNAGWELPRGLRISVDVPCKSTGCDVTTQR